MSHSKQESRKIRVPLSKEDWPKLEAELIDAEPTGSGSGEYRLLRAPFYAYGLSHSDVIGTKMESGEPVLSRIISHSGHSTYRIFRLDTAESTAFESLNAKLRELGCVVRVAKRQLSSIDVPPAADIYATYRLLEEGEAARVWEFEEGHCGHPHV